MSLVVRVLAFGTYDTRRHPRLAVLVAGLRAHGMTVEELNEPLRLTTHERVSILAQPWRLPVLGLQLLKTWAVLIRRARGRRPEVVLVGYMGHFDVHLAKRRFPGSFVVLDMLAFAADTARDRFIEGPLRTRILSRIDRSAIRACDLVLVDTAENMALLAPQERRRAMVVNVGAEDRWFEAATDSVRSHDLPLRVVFFGLFTPLQGARVIAEAISAVNGTSIHFTMIGNGQDHEVAVHAARVNQHVQWFDWVEPLELPRLVAAHHVCLGIFGVGRKAISVVPNKAYQGMAAGCALVTSDTAPQRRILGDAPVFVEPGDALALASALQQLNEDRPWLKGKRNDCRLAGNRFRPDKVVIPLLEELRSQAQK